MGGKGSKLGFKPKKHSYEYDLIVIGGGSGGVACAREAVKQGAKVALCDFVVPSPHGSQWGFGGTCVNVGCIPKRLMHQSNLIKDYLGDAPLFGWTVPDNDKVKWDTLVEHIQDLIISLNANYKATLKWEKVTVFKGFATFVNDHEINLFYPNGNEEKISGQCIVIAVGGRPNYLSIPGGTAEANLCITSDDLFSLSYPPGKTVCIGSGYIGVECAGFLAGFGFDVTLMCRSTVLKDFDQSVVKLLTQNLVGRTVGIMKNVEPIEIKLVKEGQPPTLSVSYRFIGTNAVAQIECNTVLLAVGRSPCTKDLNLAAVPGIKLDKDGYIITNKFECTNVPHIFAIGDCAKDRPKLTPPAIRAGQYLARRIYSQKKFSRIINYPVVPTAIFSPIEYGCCGLSETEAKTKFGEKNVQIYQKAANPLEFSFNKRDAEAIYAKLVCHKTKGKEKVVGFHYLGPYAGDITVGFASAVKRQCFKDELDDLIGIHPTCAEIFGQMDRSAGGQIKDPNC